MLFYRTFIRMWFLILPRDRSKGVLWTNRVYDRSEGVLRTVGVYSRFTIHDSRLTNHKSGDVETPPYKYVPYHSFWSEGQKDSFGAVKPNKRKRVG
jgi:phospholipase C